MTTAFSLLRRIKNEPFLDRLVTGDEKWILYNNIQRKRTWKQAHEGAEPVSKGGLHAMKALLCIWWDIRGVIYFLSSSFQQAKRSMPTSIVSNWSN
jgi:[histone H3]-lysine36 N-dimethyltransferase SETMAR